MRGCSLILALLTTALLPATPTHALVPEEVVVLFNPRSPASLRIARFYMTARRIPQNNLVPIITEPGESVSEEFYRTSIVLQLRKGLDDRKLTATARCLVTTFDLPLRIGPRQATPAERQELLAFGKQMEDTLTALETQIAAYDALVPAPATRPAPPTAPPAVGAATTPQPRTWQSLVPILNTAATGAAKRIDALPAASRGPAMAQFLGVHERVGGMIALLTILRVPDNAPGADEARRRLRDLSTTLTSLETQAQQALNNLHTPAGRKELVGIRAKSGGLLAEVRTIDEVSSYLKPENSESCFDNELALALWQEPYPRTNWITNPHHVEQHLIIQRMNPSAIPRSILVARLDGISPAAVEEMILTTLRTEGTGLEGKAYFDARGLHGSDAYGAYDADIRKAADWLKTNSTLETFLDDKSDLQDVKYAPDAALYCGWYSLRHYHETHQWVKGAVGYHVASLEMATLHDPKEMGWVHNLLTRGICGTLGATDEPYLTSFPKPSQFFPLLLSGQFTQGEVWQVTSPMLSWRVGFVGDPLYNPFRVKPRVKDEDLQRHVILRNAFTILRDSGTRSADTQPAATSPR
jgi:uncharacterized protein (TIGR03790 family)